MTGTLFKQTLIISLLGHLTVFSLFGFSFGPRIPAADFTQAYFRGAILRDINPLSLPDKKPDPAVNFMGKSEILAMERGGSKGPSLDTGSYLKPHAELSPEIDKALPAIAVAPAFTLSKREDPSVTFYPKLPYYLSLYFKDRQVAHIEIMFEISPAKGNNSVLIKRKISSGNLEVDLLSMRYLGHYLFIQKEAFSPDEWHTVKIDLSTLND